MPDFDSRVTVAMVSDSLDALGARHQVLSPNIHRLAGPEQVVVGPAVTVQFAPAGEVDPEDPYGGAIDYIDSLQPGVVAVVATATSNASAFWGELFSAAAIGNGAVGIVTDGYLRDIDRVRALGFPAFGAGTLPIDYRGRMRVVARNEPVLISGIRIYPGDLVVADSDGAVVVPQDKVEEVAELANARATAESTVHAELLAGDGLRAVWARHGVL